jgi:hypothetical protein
MNFPTRLFFSALLSIGLLATQNIAFAQPPANKAIEKRHSYKPKEGVIPDKETAEKVAEAILSPIYGAKAIDAQKPFDTVLSKGVWRVTGYLSPELLGGVFEIEISKRNGQILHISHGK